MFLQILHVLGATAILSPSTVAGLIAVKLTHSHAVRLLQFYESAHDVNITRRQAQL